MTPNTYYIFFQHPLDKEQKNLSKVHPLQGNQVPASIADRNRDLPTWKQIGFVSLTFNFSAFYVHQAQQHSTRVNALGLNIFPGQLVHLFFIYPASACYSN